MEVATLQAIYTATSADFDRVTDHVQRRLKETQGVASGLGGASQAVANEAKKIETTLTSRAPVKFLGIDVAGEKRAAAEVVSTARTTATQVKQATEKFDNTAFWAKQGQAAEGAAKRTNLAFTDAEIKRLASVRQAAVSEEQVVAKRVATAARATSTIARDAKTGAVLTQAELAKIIGGSAKAVEAEAAKVGKATGGVLDSLRKLFLQNNFLFRQLGQKVAGDLGFAAVGAGKLAINFEQLAGQSLTAAAGLEGAAGGAAGLLGVLGPVGIAAGVVAAGLTAMAALSIGAAAGLFLVAKSVSDTEEHLDDLSRQTGLSTDNLQVLDITTQQAGTTVDKLTNSVGQLQRKLIDASEGGTSRLSVGLKKLGIDLDDPNVALSQLIDLLSKLPAGTVRTGAAMQIFGRGGRDVAGVVDQIVENVGNADGALDRLKKQFIDAGIHIDKDGVQTAGKFHDQLIKIEAQLESVKRVVGEEALPVVLDAATKFSNWLSRNRVEVADWAKSLEHSIEKLVEIAGWLNKIAGLAPIFVPIIPIVQTIIAATGGAPNKAQQEGLSFDASTISNTRTDITTFARGSLSKDKVVQDEAARAAEAAAKASAAAAKRIRDAFAPRGGGGRGGGKGEDPAQTARRLAEIALQETLKELQAEHDALDRQLALNLASRNQYTQDAINLELKRRNATIKGLQDELSAAEKIRKPGQRAIRVAEVNARIKEEERRSASEVEKITDDSAAEQLRIGQAIAQSQLRIIETQTDRAKARIRDYANFRIITEQQAAEFEEQQTLRVFNARERILQQTKDNAKLSDEKRAEAQNALAELAAERAAFIEESSRRIEAAIRSDAEHVIQFVAQIRDAFQRAADVRLEAKEADLEPLRNSILTRHQLWDAELAFEISREDQRHRTVFRQLEDEAKLARIRIKNENELAVTLRGIRAQAEAEEELHQSRLGQLNTQAAEQRRQELLRVADDLADIANSIFDAIGKSSTEFWNSLKTTAVNFAKQIGQELFKGLLERGITGQAQGAEGLIGAIINPLLGARGPNAGIADNTRATRANTAALNANTRARGGAPAVDGSLSGVLQLIPGLFGGGRATGGPVDAGKVYRIHDSEFFRPNVSGKIYNLDQMSAALNQSGQSETRVNIAVGQDAVDDMIQSSSITPQGRRAMLIRARWNRKTGGLQFA